MRCGRSQAAQHAVLTGPAPSGALPFSWLVRSWLMTPTLQAKCSYRGGGGDVKAEGGV